MRAPRSVCVPLLLFVAASSDGFAQGRAPSIASVRGDYARGVKKLEERFATVRGSGRLTEVIFRYFPNKTDKEERTVPAEFARKPGMYRFVTNSVGPDPTKPGSENIALFNRSLSANLKKTAGSDVYAVVRSGGTGFVDQVKTSSRSRDFLNAPFTMVGPLVSDYLANPDFTITRVEEIRSGDRTLLQLTFRHNPKAPLQPRPGSLGFIESGWLRVSPAENWVLYEAEIRYSPAWGGQSALVKCVSIEYAGSHLGTPIPKRVEFKTKARLLGDKKELSNARGQVVRDGSTTSSRIFEFDRLEFDEAPDGDFNPAVFGRPDFGNPPAPKVGRGAPP